MFILNFWFLISSLLCAQYKYSVFHIQVLYTQYWIEFIICSSIFVEENFKIIKTLNSYSLYLFSWIIFQSFVIRISCWNFVIESASYWSFVVRTASYWSFVVRAASCWSFVVETAFWIKNFVFRASETFFWEMIEKYIMINDIEFFKVLLFLKILFFKRSAFFENDFFVEILFCIQLCLFNL